MFLVGFLIFACSLIDEINQQIFNPEKSMQIRTKKKNISANVKKKNQCQVSRQHQFLFLFCCVFLFSSRNMFNWFLFLITTDEKCLSIIIASRKKQQTPSIKLQKIIKKKYAANFSSWATNDATQSSLEKSLRLNSLDKIE